MQVTRQTRPLVFNGINRHGREMCKFLHRTVQNSTTFRVRMRFPSGRKFLISQRNGWCMRDLRDSEVEEKVESG